MDGVDADAEDQNWAESPRIRTDAPEMRTDAPGMQTDEPGMWTDEPGMWTGKSGADGLGASARQDG